jgi:type IV pilus assembly protein PilN
MSNINLLPWRQELRDRARSAYYKVLIITGLIGLAIVICSAFGLDQLKNNEDAKATFLKSEISSVERELQEIKKLKEKKQELIDRMNAIDSLQQSRNIAVHLYSDLPTLTSTGLYLKSMDYKNRTISVRGLAESNPRVSSMLRNVDNSKWLGNSVIVQTKAEVRDGKKVVPTLPDGLYEFEMKFSVTDSSNSQKGGR